jgi:hypothetical protein
MDTTVAEALNVEEDPRVVEYLEDMEVVEGSALVAAALDTISSCRGIW